jgi:hypothetical protein
MSRKWLLPLGVALVWIGSVFYGCSSSANREVIQLPDGTSYVVTYKQQGDSLKWGYYEDGTLYYKSLKKKGFGSFTETESYTYFPNGNIRKYAFFLNDSLRYFRFYDQNGHPTESDGCALVYLANDVTFVDSLNVNEPYFQQLRLAIPPQSTMRILYGNEVANELTRQLNTDPLDFLPLKENLSGMLVKFEQPGIYHKVLYWSLQDSVTGEIEKGRVWRQFVVQ